MEYVPINSDLIKPGVNAFEAAEQEFLDKFRDEYDIEEHEVQSKFKVYLLLSKKIKDIENWNDGEDEDFRDSLLTDAVDSLSSGGIGVLMNISDVDIYSCTDWECFEEEEKTKLFILRPETEWIKKEEKE